MLGRLAVVGETNSVEGSAGNHLGFDRVPFKGTKVGVAFDGGIGVWLLVSMGGLSEEEEIRHTHPRGSLADKVDLNINIGSGGAELGNPDRDIEACVLCNGPRFGHARLEVFEITTRCIPRRKLAFARSLWF